MSELQYYKNASVCLSFNKAVPVENSVSRSTTSALAIDDVV